MTDIIQELTSLGIPLAAAKTQVELLARGTQYIELSRSAAIGDGIVRLSEQEVQDSIDTYDSRNQNVKVLKFVPASGAATRMFKDLKRFLESGKANASTRHFFDKIDEIAFIDQLNISESEEEIVQQMLGKTSLGLADSPKGSILFHRYQDAPRTAFEEHLVEGSSYATTDNKVHIHFTIAPNHLDRIKADMKRWSANYGTMLNVEYDLRFSVQREETNTMCVDSNGHAIRSSDNKLILRPGGHGSLIHNLNALDADVIFIKNIDNVVPDNHRADTIKYKKAIGGLLIQVRKEARKHIEDLKTTTNKVDAVAFLQKMGVRVDETTDSKELIRLMNRPYRVCGMVKNEGEPGGGPFWVKSDGEESLQIVESAQIDLKVTENRNMLDQGTHFNPVDLVCCLNDLYGQRQDLFNFVDMKSAFVTEKLVDGRKARVLEWPGLWNGAMAHWNSLFVEVPVSTFNPVKTVNDLLRAMHQPSNP